MKIKIVGTGSFGSFLLGLFSSIASSSKEDFEITEDYHADIVFLAVPFDAYNEVANDHKSCGLLVNVCSIQEQATKICLNHHNNVLGFHPMFGARTPDGAHKTCLVTHSPTTEKGTLLSKFVFDMFESVGANIIKHTPEGRLLTGEWHDKLMAKSHLKALAIAERAAKDLSGFDEIPNKYLPATVIALRKLVGQLRDMPEGTRSSINANTYKDKQAAQAIKNRRANMNTRNNSTYSASEEMEDIAHVIKKERKYLTPNGGYSKHIILGELFEMEEAIEYAKESKDNLVVVPVTDLASNLDSIEAHLDRIIRIRNEMADL